MTQPILSDYALEYSIHIYIHTHIYTSYSIIYPILDPFSMYFRRILTTKTPKGVHLAAADVGLRGPGHWPCGPAAMESRNRMARVSVISQWSDQIESKSNLNLYLYLNLYLNHSKSIYIYICKWWTLVLTCAEPCHAPQFEIGQGKRGCALGWYRCAVSCRGL